ncbi:hypothetical protein C0Q70_00230 [Pomacea canaliculata]|uniref:Uncharacterized protein n=1 Tax=Pomacea canaliculata TaxID=400727 RepID=A0A2T7PW41_POMCA|nr:hypothetical protein C0Q70_00230 [Pomacea canaliculata]
MGVTQWIIITIILAFIGLLLQVAGYVAPMWIWLETDSFLVGVGLWFTTGCGLSGTCGENTTTPEVSFIYATDGMYRQTEFDAVRALETLGLGAATFLLLVLVVYRMGYGKWDRMGQLNWAAFCLSSLAWLLILAGLVVYCAFFWPVVGTSPLLTRRSFPWSLLMCLLAAFFFIVVCVLIRVKCRDASDYVKNAIPTSGDHKLDLNPVTKTGLMNRYFSPSPYQEDRRSVPALSAYHDEGNGGGVDVIDIFVSDKSFLLVAASTQ